MISSSDIVESVSTYYVGGTGNGNFSSIRDAIFQAEDNSRILVYPGVYNESIDLYKKIHLESIYPHQAIIEFNGTDDIVSITTNECSLIGFNISSQRNDSFTGLTITSDNNLIRDNIFFNNVGKGLYLYRSRQNVILNNSFFNDGINIVGDVDEWSSHQILKNTVNNKPLLFIKNKNDTIIQFRQFGQLVVANCSKFVIKNCTISGGEQGLLIGHSSHCSLHDNEIFENEEGILLSYCSHFSIYKNKIHDNNYGIYILHSNLNQIYLNFIENNSIVGCRICCGSKFNSVYQNNFINNYQSSFDSYNNSWYKDERGNYWSDYSGFDGDNDDIGDSPYIIPGNSTIDKYPLIEPTSTLINPNKGNNNSREMPFISSFLMIILLFLFVFLRRNINIK